MPLPQPGVREEIHIRTIDMHGYRRPDGLYEIDGRITDTKRHPFEKGNDGEILQPGCPLHDMSVRLVVDEDLLVHDVLAVTDASPYPDCPHAMVHMKKLIGVRIASGWWAAVKQHVGGANGCTHVRELLSTLASAAYQTLTQTRRNKIAALGAKEDMAKLNTCYATGSESESARRRWPELLKGLSVTGSKEK